MLQGGQALPATLPDTDPIWHLVALLLVACTALSACGVAASKLTVTLHVGETVSLGASGDSVSLDRVVEDSRCPANAQCIWAGRVVVAGTLRYDGQATPFTLGTARDLADAPASVAVGPYELSIAGVEPYPDTPAGIDQDAYALSLALERAPQTQETP